MKPKPTPSMKPKKQKTVKARRIFAITAGGHLSQCHLTDLMAFESESRANAVVNRNVETVEPCFVLPADAASYAQMVEQMARGMFANAGHSATWGGVEFELHNDYYRGARCALAAIGIKEPRR